MLPFLGLVVGIIIGFNFMPMNIAYDYSNYVAVAILGAIDSVFGGIVATMKNNFNMKVFLSGFIGNALLGAAMAYIGDKLGIQLYLAAIFAFGNRIFLNFAIMRRLIIDKYWPDEVVTESTNNIDTVVKASILSENNSEAKEVVVVPSETATPTSININIQTGLDADTTIVANKEVANEDIKETVDE